MSEADSAICITKRKVEWSNMPYDLLSNIANRLDLIDFTNFHHVCKNWGNVNEPLVEATIGGCDPLLLLYGEGSHCSILNNNDKVYTAEIPELDRATCLASYDGWLLVFRGGSLFFFCPFSRAKIQLPSCPFTKLHYHIAAFSSAPTSQDCIVAVINHVNDNELELHMLRRGDHIWAENKFSLRRDRFLRNNRCALFIKGEFIYSDGQHVLIFDAANSGQWSKCSLRAIMQYQSIDASLTSRLRDLLSEKAKNEKKYRVGLDDNVTISTICGTVCNAQNMMWGDCIRSIVPERRETFRYRHHLKGAWILPRYHKHPYQSCETKWNSKMSEADSAICITKRKVEWSNVPYDLLSNIANRLDLIDFTNFHHVCKNWGNVNEPLVEATIGGCDPLLLLYGEGSHCSILNNNDKVYTAEIPELDRATCLASYDGWLLVFRGGSLFFFCPFSRAKIQLPSCPFTKLHYHIAAFSSAPTSQDCIVAVINHVNDNELELHMLRRGDHIWAENKFSLRRDRFLRNNRCALFIKGEFIYSDGQHVLIFDAANSGQWSKCSLRAIMQYQSIDASLTSRLRDLLSEKAKNEKKYRVGLDDNVTISTICGTVCNAQNMMWGDCIRSIVPERRETFRYRHHLKGAWILPRYHKHPYQSW